MTKDIGIVILPTKQCKEFANHMTAVTAKALPNFKNSFTHPHITLFHIANVAENDEAKIKQVFSEFRKIDGWCPLNIKGIKATGGSEMEGFKWLDLQFKSSSKLANLREKAIEIFSPFHNGHLARMEDGMNKITAEQKEEIEKYGVTTSNYVPHITTWYIDLPNEPKTSELQIIAERFADEIGNLQCQTASIALVELGRNGNAVEIIDEYSFYAKGLITSSDYDTVEE